MSEYSASDSYEDSDDSSESGSRSERPAVVSLGSFAASAEKTVDSKPPETFWNRGAAESEASKQSFLAELVGEKPITEADDDDDVESNADDRKNAAETLEDLSDDEQRVAAIDYAQQRQAGLRIEHDAVTDPGQAAEVAADELFIENIDEQLAADQTSTVEEALEAAADQTERDIDAAVADAQDSAPENSAESPDGNKEAEDDDQTTGPTPGPTKTPPPYVPPGSPPGPPMPPVTPPGPPTPPPGPPLPPLPPVVSPGPGFRPPSPPAPSFNTINAPTSVLTQEDIDAARRRGEVSGLLVGGILGYLYGRRKGRIKTERKLLPIQKNLQNQVKDLHDTVDDRERAIRGLAADKINNIDELQRSRAAEQLSAQAAKRNFENRQPASKFNQELQRLIPEDRPNYQPSASQMLVGAERVVGGQPHIERIENLSEKEILEMSETVIIAGARLRDIYENKLVTQLGMKHILTEFLRGGDVKKALDQELAVKQLTFERDPLLRDQISAGVSGSQGSAGGAASAAALAGAAHEPSRNAQQAQQMPSPQPTMASPATAHNPYAGTNTATNAPKSDKPEKSDAAVKREQIMVGGWMLAIAIMLIVVFVLISQRS